MRVPINHKKLYYNYYTYNPPTSPPPQRQMLRYDPDGCILGASVAKWLAHPPFTSEAAGSSLSENFLNATRTQSSCEKSKSQRSAESRGFPPVLRFPPTGKFDRVG